MGRVAEAKHCKKEYLLSAVSEILSNGTHSWEQVANLYKNKSEKIELLDNDEVKRHQTKKCETNSRNQQVRLVLQRILTFAARECS